MTQQDRGGSKVAWKLIGNPINCQLLSANCQPSAYKTLTGHVRENWSCGMMQNIQHEAQSKGTEMM